MRSIEKRIYAYVFAVDFILIYPFYAVMFVDNGLSTAQISLLFFAWSATTIFEVPSGVLADRFDRRYVLVASQTLVACGFVCWLLFSDFWGFLAGFLLWGIAGTLSSGAFEALVYDELKSRGEESRYAKVNGRAEGWALIAILSSTVLAATTPDSSYSIPLVASIVVSLIAGVIALSLPRVVPMEELADSRFFEILREGVAVTFRSRKLLRAVLPAAVALMIFGTLEEYAPLFMSDVGLQHSALALTLAALGAVSAAAAFLAHHGEEMSGRGVWLVLALSGILLIVAALFQNKPAIILLGAFFFLAKAAEVITSARVQHAIEAPMRATITSVSNFTAEAFAVIIYAIFAFAPDDNRFTGFLVSGALLTFVSLLLAFWQRHDPNLRDSSGAT